VLIFIIEQWLWESYRAKGFVARVFSFASGFIWKERETF